MPKMKSHSGAKKRFKLTAKGKVRARHAMKSHILQKKNAKRRRRLDEPLMLKPQDAKRVKGLLGK
jgi:large subunit ribosomal protein L35